MDKYVLAAIRILVGMVRAAEDERGQAAEEASLCVDIGTTDGKTEAWEIIIRRAPAPKEKAANDQGEDA